MSFCRLRLCSALLALACGCTLQATEGAPSERDISELHTLAESLWNDYAPPSVKAEYELISREELVALFKHLDSAGEETDLGKLAAYAPETRQAIAAIRSQPDYADYANWLQERLDEMEAATTALTAPSPTPPDIIPTPAPVPATPPAPPSHAKKLPYYELSLARVARRPRPPRADEFLPSLRAAFAAQGVPEALVWLAETESSFNPKARSPAGARGLFQLMPDTARGLGLDLWPSDQRTNPELSARAAATLLRRLHGRFGTWPLALAAYNAGEGRVSRELKKRDSSDYAAIADHLPAETRLYVPKVLATVETRAGVSPADLAAPTTP